MQNGSFLARRTHSLPDEKRPAFSLALLSSALTTLAGAAYFVVMVCLAATGKMTLPPPDWAQLFGGIVTAAAVLLLPVLFVALHHLVPASARVYSLLGIVFTTLFAAFVGINRFVQLSIVRLSLLEGNAEDLARFLPYDPRSALFALEIVGWGIFLSLAVFFLALALGKTGLPGAARWCFLLYALLGLIGGIAFITNSPLAIVGFAAWGCVLFVGTGLLTLALLSYDRHWAGDPVQHSSGQINMTN